MIIDVGHCLKNLRKRIDEKAKDQKQLAGLGEKLANFFRAEVKRTASTEGWSEEDKAQHLTQVFQNAAAHYSGDHKQKFTAGRKCL